MSGSDNKVKRYDCTNGGAQHCYGCYTMKGDELGDYVEWEAYEALKAERDAWHERAVMTLEKKNEWADRARKAESERNYLITETEKLRKDSETLVEALEDIGASWHGVQTELEKYMRNVARRALAARTLEQPTT